jgi:hypothetical protein
VVTLVLGWLLASLSRGASAWAAELTFSSKTLDPKAGEVVYAVIAADVDGDRRPDVVAVTENRVVWYQNPDWTPRVIVADQVERDHVCIAPLDLDGDGQLEFALGAGWLNNRHLGSLYWLKRRESLDQPWQAHRLGEESWTHRIRFGDLLGTGTPQLVVSPLNKSVATGARLLAFQVPSRESLKNPWQATPIDTSLNAIHAHWVGDLDGDQHSDMVTASQEGVHWFRRGTGGQFSKTLISRGLPGDPPTAQKTGAGEIRPGRLRDGRRILATVEPMHGTHVVLYISPAGFPVGESLSGTWQRLVLDDSLVRGHAIWPADLDGDGQDEIVVGHSDKGLSIGGMRPARRGSSRRWTRGALPAKTLWSRISPATAVPISQPGGERRTMSGSTSMAGSSSGFSATGGQDGAGGGGGQPQERGVACVPRTARGRGTGGLFGPLAGPQAAAGKAGARGRHLRLRF